MFLFLRNIQSLSDFLDSEEVDEKLQKSKEGRFDMKVTLSCLIVAGHCERDREIKRDIYTFFYKKAIFLPEPQFS